MLNSRTAAIALKAKSGAVT